MTERNLSDRPTGSPALSAGEVEWNFLDTIRRAVRSRNKLGVAILIGALLGGVLALILKPYFVAQAVFLPPKEATAPSPGAAIILGGSDLSDTYLGMLASRTVADDIIDHVGLLAEYHTQDREIARLRLAISSKFSVDKNSLIEVRITAGSPQLAPRIANAYLDALYRLNGQMVTNASEHRRAFFEDQLQQQKNALSRAEVDLKNTQQQTGVVLPAGEALAGLNATANLEAEINAVETRLAGLMTGETEQAPEVVQTRSQLAQLRAELARQQSASRPRGQAAGIASNGQMPELQLEYDQKAREVKLRESVYDTLVQDYERARLSSIDPGPQLQIVDRAIEPEHKSGPPRKLLVLGGAAVTFLCTLLWILLAPPIRRFLKLISEPAPSGLR
jgi:tyrosine-protein kinase Etk/Wzc